MDLYSNPNVNGPQPRTKTALEVQIETLFALSAKKTELEVQIENIDKSMNDIVSTLEADDPVVAQGIKQTMQMLAQAQKQQLRASTTHIK